MLYGVSWSTESPGVRQPFAPDISAGSDNSRSSSRDRSVRTGDESGLTNRFSISLSGHGRLGQGSIFVDSLKPLVHLAKGC